MRTTVTLDDDVARLLKDRARERDLPFKHVLNDAIRAGLAIRPSGRPYRMRPRDLGSQAGVDLSRALELAAGLEDVEIARKLEQGR